MGKDLWNMNLTVFHGKDVKEYTFQPDGGAEKQLLNLYPDCEGETFEGFGGAITDAAGYVYSLMEEKDRNHLMKTCFTSEGMNYEWVRIPIDSCDFSTQMYEAMSDPRDRALKSFSFERTETYILPMLSDAQKAAGRPLSIMLSPWSPPAFMKTNESRIGGSLKKEYYSFWAAYICRYIKEFVDRGFRVKRISLQNEPKAWQTWDSCVFTAEEEKSFLKVMDRALKEHGLSNVEVFFWDHNKERVFERARSVIDDQTKEMVTGAACHWYSGDHFESLDLMRKYYPGLKLIMSESCIEYSIYEKDDKANAFRLSHEIIGDLSHGISSFIDWNILLDGSGGPNHKGNLCLSPFMYDIEKRQLKEMELLSHYMQFAHFIQAGDVRIASSAYTRDLENTAFRKPDGSLVVVLLNRTAKELPVKVRLKGQIATIRLPEESLVTCVVKE